MNNIVPMKKVPDMFQSFDQMEDAVSKAAGLFDLLSFTAGQDRSSCGSPTEAAANGIARLSQAVTDELHVAFTNLRDSYGDELKKEKPARSPRQTA